MLAKRPDCSINGAAMARTAAEMLAALLLCSACATLVAGQPGKKDLHLDAHDKKRGWGCCTYGRVGGAADCC